MDEVDGGNHIKFEDGLEIECLFTAKNNEEIVVIDFIKKKGPLWDFNLKYKELGKLMI